MRKLIYILAVALLLSWSIVPSASAGEVPGGTRAVHLIDTTGNYSLVTNSGAQLVVGADYRLHQLHLGNFYSASIYNTLDSAAISNVIINTPTSAYMHLTPMAHAQDEASMAWYRSPTCSSLGSAVAISNRNDSSTSSASAEVYERPVCSSNGTALPGWTRYVGNTPSFGEDPGFNELILNTTTLYLIQWTSGENGNELNHVYGWHEETGTAP